MTSKNLFSEKKVCDRIWGLMKEDIKRRIWVLALMFLVFFFALPVKLALVMENARRMEFRAYNDYEPIEKLLPEHFTAKQYEMMTAFLKREVVLDEISYGNGLMVFLFLMAAVVVGVTAFSYLHNKKKVDFYHSIPVRREVLFAVQYGDGILIPAAAYLFGCLLFTAVAAAYGVPVSEFFGSMAAAFGMNLLYYSLVYGTVTVAMMMTGNIVIGLLGTAVFFGFVPLAAGLLGAFADQFFVTSAGEFWYADSSPYLWAMQNLSPVGAYIWSAASVSDADGIKMAEVLKAAACMMAVTALSLELYRLRPSEAAGKAMAFSKSKAPVRILLVLLGGMAGGWFFWTLQSQVKWGLFGTAAGILLVHCMVEIIYHFDFKKLFSHKMQLALCLGAGMLFFCSFRYDWYGYDSYVPSQEEIASASVDLSIDYSFAANMPRVMRQGDTRRLIYESAGDFIKEKMELTDFESVIALAEAASREAAGYREEKLNRWEAQISLNEVSMSVNHYSSKDASAISVIGGADGPTSVFVAGKEEEEAYDRYFSQILIRYRLKNGRQVSRRYHMDLEDVLET
ncbi:MAG: ABC transporter permease, partial [Clostridium sp.]|nr:ABC transporter permease [Clostridium sp.]